MNINKLFPSRFLKAGDLGAKEYTLTIGKFVIEDVGQPPQREEKPVIYFKEAKKGLILNRTNAMTITGMYTPETDNWIGKRITLYSEKVKAFGAIHDAVRIRPDVPKPPKSDNGNGPPSGPLEQGIDDMEDVVDDVDLDHGDAERGQGVSASGNPFDDDHEPTTNDAGGDEPKNPVTPDTLKALHATGTQAYGKEWDAKRPELVAAISTGATRSSKELTETEAKRLIAGMQAKQAKQTQVAILGQNGHAEPA